MLPPLGLRMRMRLETNVLRQPPADILNHDINFPCVNKLRIDDYARIRLRANKSAS